MKLTIYAPKLHGTNATYWRYAHWFDSYYIRKSAAIASRCFIGTHDFPAFASLLNSINEDLSLCQINVVITVTDNGNNFVKAFREYNAPSVTEKESELPVYSVSEYFDDGFH